MPKPERHVLVCINERPADNPKGSCAAKGSPALYEQLKAMAKERGLGGRVIVNGVAVVWDGQATSARPGRPLRRR